VQNAEQRQRARGVFSGIERGPEGTEGFKGAQRSWDCENTKTAINGVDIPPSV